MQVQWFVNAVPYVTIKLKTVDLNSSFAPPFKFNRMVCAAAENIYFWRHRGVITFFYSPQRAKKKYCATAIRKHGILVDEQRVLGVGYGKIP